MPEPEDNKPASPANTIGPDPLLRKFLTKWLAWKQTAPGHSKRQAEDTFLRLVWEQSQTETVSESTRDLIDSMLCESDRGCVLVAAAIIDNELEALFKAVFRANSAATSKDIDFLLTAPLAPLKSTSIKIRLAFALGWIDVDLNKALAALQKLRSAVAAHSRTAMTLTEDNVIEIAKHLSKEAKEVFKSIVGSPDVAVAMPIFGHSASVAKTLFAFLAIFLIEMLENARAAAAAQSSGGSSQ
jgi:DNA-binding MltR family transcriptional regulator